MYVPQVSHKPYRTFMLGHYVCQTNFFNRINFFSCLDLSDRNKTCLPSPPEIGELHSSHTENDIVR